MGLFANIIEINKLKAKVKNGLTPSWLKKSEYQQMQESVVLLGNGVNELQTDFDNLESDLIELTTTVNGNSTNIQTLNGSLVALTGVVNGISDDVDNNTSDISSLDTRVTALESGTPIPQGYENKYVEYSSLQGFNSPIVGEFKGKPLYRYMDFENTSGSKSYFITYRRFTPNPDMYNIDEIVDCRVLNGGSSHCSATVEYTGTSQQVSFSGNFNKACNYIIEYTLKEI